MPAWQTRTGRYDKHRVLCGPAGVNKSLPPMGHIHIAGIVNISGFMEYLFANTRLNLVMRMADIINSGIHFNIWKYVKDADDLSGQ